MISITKIKELKRLMLVVMVLLSCNIICLSVVEVLGGVMLFSEMPTDMETEKGEKEKEKEKEEEKESERDKFFHNGFANSNYLNSCALSYNEGEDHLTLCYLEVTSPPPELS